MTTHFLKRYRMEIDLREVDLAEAVLPEGYDWHAWSSSLVRDHARVTVAAFRNSIDCNLFPRLAEEQACCDLMRDITSHSCFVPEATWLICFIGNEFQGPSPVGAIQGLGGISGTAAIQNVAVVPAHQHFGLGRALVLKALRGFANRRLFRVTLDASAENTAALRLYESLGFRHEQTRFKKLAIPIEEPVSS